MLRRRRHILFLLNSLPAAGGAEQFVLNQIRRTDRARFDLSVCQAGGSRVLRRFFEELDVPVYDLAERFRPDPRTLSRLVVLLRHKAVDILQAHIPYSVILGRLAGRMCRVPAVVSTEQGMYYQYRPMTKTALDLTIRMCDANVFISRACFDATAARHPFLRAMPPIIIPNGIDAAALASMAGASRADVRRELGLAQEDIAFGNVARLEKVKGQNTLVRAFVEIRRRLSRARLFIAGRGAFESDLKRLVETYGVSNHVVFLGERTDVPRLLGAFDVYVHPGRIEALGVAVLEAMAAGLPTIAAAVDALPEFVQEGETGWLVAPNNVEALADRMLQVGSRLDDARSIATRAQAKVRRDYDIGSSVAAYEALYETLLASKESAHGRLRSSYDLQDLEQVGPSR